MHTFGHFNASLVLIGLLAGCSGGDDANRVPVFPVTGKITMNNAPVAGATVSFSPEENQPVAYATTNDQGEYSLTTYETGDGAAAGSYTVLVSKSVAPAASAPAGGHEQAYQAGTSAGHSAGAARGTGSVLPQKYAQATTSDLKATVKDGENKYDFDLKP